MNPTRKFTDLNMYALVVSIVCNVSAQEAIKRMGLYSQPWQTKGGKSYLKRQAKKGGQEEMHSFKDTRGHLWVACSECERGGNGSDKDKCSSGWQTKRFQGQGCFSGTLMQKYIPPEQKNKPEGS